VHRRTVFGSDVEEGCAPKGEQAAAGLSAIQLRVAAVEERRVGIESSEFVGAVQRMRSAYKTELDADNDGRGCNLLDDHSAGGHPHRDLSSIASHYITRCPQADRVDAASFRGPVDEHFEVSSNRQCVTAAKRDACVTCPRFLYQPKVEFPWVDHTPFVALRTLPPSPSSQQL
jgi:hypothetical protein